MTELVAEIDRREADDRGYLLISIRIKEIEKRLTTTSYSFQFFYLPGLC